MQEKVLILDFGGQYNQLIARRVRENNVYCELKPSHTSLAEIRAHIEKLYYTIDFTLDEIRPDYAFDVSCQGSVPQAFEALFESTGFEDAVRNAISIGGDSDTIGAITGSMAEAYYGVPADLRDQALSFLDKTQLDIFNAFETAFGRRNGTTDTQ